MSPVLELRNVSFAHGATPVIAGIDLVIPTGQLVSLLGPSGSGKTTLLRLAAGLERPTTGAVRWAGVPLERPSVRQGIVFQDYSLFPWMTLRQNVELAIQKARAELSRAERRELAEEYLGLVGLANAVARYPFELSGGMRQRGAIARAFALGSDLLLLDEPFGALDPVNRALLQDLLLRVWSAGTPRKTVVLVTHDLSEALLLGSRVLVLGSSPGRLIADLPVPFPYPRTRRVLFDAPEYVALEERIAACYRHDVMARIDARETVTGPAELI
jgi:NitT/TauT family transport system ATP-binding protein